MMGHSTTRVICSVDKSLRDIINGLVTVDFDTFILDIGLHVVKTSRFMSICAELDSTLSLYPEAVPSSRPFSGDLPDPNARTIREVVAPLWWELQIASRSLGSCLLNAFRG